MAFFSGVQRFLRHSSHNLTSVRLNSTLTSPKLFISGSDLEPSLSNQDSCVKAPFETSESPLESKGRVVDFDSGLSGLMTDQKLSEAFAPFGQLIEAKVITDRVTGRPKGFGFVTYTSIEEAEKAREEMNAKFLDGWAIFVDPAKPRERPPHWNDRLATPRNEGYY